MLVLRWAIVALWATCFFILAGNKDNYKVSDEFDNGMRPRLAALDQLKKIFYLLENYSKYFDD